ncbi:MAG: HemK2/MTQ2 family protein methyltransferase, partial [Nanoarchaeota archaeon]
KSEIYSPAEDSYLLAESVKEYLNNLLKENKKLSKSNRCLANHKQTKHNVHITDKNINIFNIKILDMGAGSGIQALVCRKLGFKNILAADINQKAVKQLKKQKIKAIRSNLFSKINKKQKFDLIIFNPPYLPEDKYDKKQDTTAGKQGYELIIRFLKQAKFHLNKEGTILLLFSSLSKPKIIIKKAKQLGYKLKPLNSKKLFFEKLYVYEIYMSKD